MTLFNALNSVCIVGIVPVKLMKFAAQAAAAAAEKINEELSAQPSVIEEVAYQSDTSEGGTRYIKKITRQRLADGTLSCCCYCRRGTSPSSINR